MIAREMELNTRQSRITGIAPFAARPVIWAWKSTLGILVLHGERLLRAYINLRLDNSRAIVCAQHALNPTRDSQLLRHEP